VVTNCHVIRDALAVRVSGVGRLWEATEQSGDTLRDLCFLRVPTWRADPVVLGSADSLREAQPVAALGFSGGTAISLKLGHVAALHSLNFVRIIESDTAFTPGASGGGLFDANGALVGVLTFRDRAQGNSFYSLPVAWIRDRLPAESQCSALNALGGPRALWQGDTDTLPCFMRANLLETQGWWRALLEVADRWPSSFPQDSEALIVRARALQKLEHPGAAAAVFSEALRLAPDNPAAWYGLAMAYEALGDRPALQRARAKLDVLDEDVAAQLEEELARSQRQGEAGSRTGDVSPKLPPSGDRSAGAAMIRVDHALLFVGTLAASVAHANDFPTRARVEFVLECMRSSKAPAEEAMYKCSCAIDEIAEKVDYATWVELSTVANATTIAGERGGVLRDMKDGRKLTASFRELQADAKKRCFLKE
jgi:tetratricopeptide (TPR) repeat protein